MNPSFKDVKREFAKHGVAWNKVPVFKNSDLESARFEKEGKWTSADLDDDELVEPELVEGWCRKLEIDRGKLKIDSPSGPVSVSPPDSE